MKERQRGAAGVSLASLRDVPVNDLFIRFGFGATVSAVAALITNFSGARIGGVFLAFPAILPATLTLIEQEESGRDAAADDTGAVFGAIALVVFAGLTWWLLRGIGAPAIAVAGFGWLSAAVLLYVILRLTASRRCD